MAPNETKNLSWKDAWWYLLNGKHIKRPLWDGYWVWENNTIMMHCRDGSVTDIRDTEFPAYTFSNIAQRDWMVVEDGEGHVNDDMIRRQVALDTVERMYKACEGSLSDYHDLLVAAFMDLTPAHGDGDTISRAVAIADAKQLCEEELCDDCHIVSKLVERLENLPSAQPNLSEAYSKAVFTWLMDYQIRAAELNGRYTPYEVLSWVINDWRKENG